MKCDCVSDERLNTLTWGEIVVRDVFWNSHEVRGDYETYEEPTSDFQW
jgi:hypothetical protein